MKTIHLPEGIEVQDHENGSFTISSDLKEYCLGCGKADCYFDCDNSQDLPETELEALNRLQWNAAVDGVEGFIIALASAGIDIDTDAFRSAVQTLVDKLAQVFAD